MTTQPLFRPAQQSPLAILAHYHLVQNLLSFYQKRLLFVSILTYSVDRFGTTIVPNYQHSDLPGNLSH